MASQQVGYRCAGSWVQRKRAEVLHDDQITVLERRLERRLIHRFSCAKVKSWDRDDPKWPGSGDHPHLPAELAERPGPLGGLDRDAIGSCEAIRDDPCDSHEMERRADKRQGIGGGLD